MKYSKLTEFSSKIHRFFCDTTNQSVIFFADGNLHIVKNLVEKKLKANFLGIGLNKVFYRLDTIIVTSIDDSSTFFIDNSAIKKHSKKWIDYSQNHDLFLTRESVSSGQFLQNTQFFNANGDIFLWQREKTSTGSIIGDKFLVQSNIFQPLFCHNISTGEVLWIYSFAGYPKTKNIRGKEEAVSVAGYTGVVDNKLWISLNTLQHLVLDIDTGEQIALLGQPYKYTKDYYSQKVMSGGQIDEKQKKIISLGNSQYREINTDTFEATFIDLREEFDKYGVSSVGDTRFDDDYIYFYDKIFFGEQPRNKVAVLDRKTLKVVWVHDFAQYGTFPMQMEKTDRHLFVLDSGGTLPIFERDEVA